MSEWYQPNICFCLFDIVRADTFGLQGQGIMPSPYLRELSGQSAFFPNALAPDTYTPTSHAAILTGRDAIFHADLGPRKPYYGLADFLSFNGYESLLLSDNPYLNALMPYFSGFEAMQLLTDQTALDDERALAFYPREKHPHRYGAQRPRNLEANIPGWERLFEVFKVLEGRAVRWVEVDDHFSFDTYAQWRYGPLLDHLARRAQRPLFMFFNIMGYVMWCRDKRGLESWWAEFFRLNFGRRPTTPEVELLRRDFEDSGLYVRDKKMTASVEFGRISKALYLACSAAIHRELMLLLGDAGALGEDSVRILSVDHGHMWHEHGELFLEHGPTNNVYQPLLNTPLCIQAPFLSVKAHRQRVMLTDIFPTLNQRISAFAPVDEACFNPYYAMPLDQRLESGEPLAFATEAGSCVVYLDEFKAVWNHRVGRPSLCHALVGDPNEERNLFARVDSGAIRRMRETIADYFARESGCLRAVLPLAGEQEFVGISEETKSALAALGYLE